MRTKAVARRCHECGTGKVTPMTGAGRKERYRTLVLEIPAHIEIPTCDNCGAEWMDPATARAIDESLKRVYHDALRNRMLEALKRIRVHASMRKVEYLLGLSEGYLSKVSKERSQPSAELVSHLGLISMSPIERLNDLEKFWTYSSKRTPSTTRKSARSATSGISAT